MAKILTGLVAFSLCLVAGVVLWAIPFFYPGPGAVLEKWEAQRGGLKIVATSYIEEKAFLPGAYYFYEAFDRSKTKREIMNFRYDDPRPINRDGIGFVNDDIAYVFMGRHYAVTTDGGRSWSVLEIDKAVPALPWRDYGVIQDVRVSADGAGRMKLERYPGPDPHRQNDVPELVTKDFGRHWSVVP